MAQTRGVRRRAARSAIRGGLCLCAPFLLLKPLSLFVATGVCERPDGGPVPREGSLGLLGELGTRRTGKLRPRVLGGRERAACGDLADSPNSDVLRKQLQGLWAEHVFFDIDETIVMPDTPVIFGMPGSDAFLETLGPCEREVMSELGRRMEAAYYDAPLKLVDPELPALIAELQSAGKSVWALTSRSSSGPHEWHTRRVVDFLAASGIRLSPLPSGVGGLGNNTKAGGIFFADGLLKNKGSLIARVVPAGESAVLVDNTRSKLTKALASGRSCLRGIHFTAADAREHTDASRRRWVCQQLTRLSLRCGARCTLEAGEGGAEL